MPPKQDPSIPVDITVRVTGGVSGNPASLAPKVGPLGLSPKKIADDIAKVTKDWTGLRITVHLRVQNRQAEITVVPSAAALLIRALNEPKVNAPKGTPTHHKGNLTIDDIVEVAACMRPRSMARSFKGTVKEILGTASSIGCTVDGAPPSAALEKLEAGEFDEKFEGRA
eukprot:TRINITY_DN2007_c0_g1_i4.p1 TRINITY_DN2007_c0_g1~~TRINITY_DN2007_c0_g1_i4.p1  ORF type:complete len:169 (-),score=21.44 TRINITY_DN2007_c0_g1_i4:52-558(-)